MDKIKNSGEPCRSQTIQRQALEGQKTDQVKKFDKIRQKFLEKYTNNPTSYN